MDSLKAPSLQSLLDSDRGSNDSLLAESLQIDFEELDDAEYSIPQIDALPTLESILNEVDTESDIISEGGISLRTPTPSMGDFIRSGSMLKHSPLQGVSNQIASAADRTGAGTASSVAVNNFIAVGTSHGYILGFDAAQTLRWCCQEFSSHGAVAALSLNADSSRLLAGFARGQIIMIDSKNGDVVRILTDVITPNSGVLHIKWTARPNLALCSDSGGSVWSLSFTKRLGIRGYESRCLFSGARGEVCAMEPLNVIEFDHPIKNSCLVALATLTKFFVVMIRPRLKVIKFQPMSGPGECLPLLAWQMVLIQAADTSKTIEPVLAAGRGNQLYFYQVTSRLGRIGLIFLRHIQLSYSLLALHWMGPKTLVLIEVSERLHINDVRTNKEWESLDCANFGLVYNSAQFKGLATGGNVSPALALAGTLACYNSIAIDNQQLFILGGRNLYQIGIRSWSDRLTYLVEKGNWSAACYLAIDTYRASLNKPKRQQIAHDRIMEMMNDYVSETNQNPEASLPAVMALLIEIKEYEFLWHEIWERLTIPDLFLTLLSEHIENEQISIIAPLIAQALCEYWLRINPHKLEDLILKLEWQCLDLNLVLKAVKREKLFRAQIYLNTKALQDYTVSITELVPQIPTEGVGLGNILLVYISSCLAGRSYPVGLIEQEQVGYVKHEILRCLMSIHSNSAPDDELPYPYLRGLLTFDTRATLNVLSLAFQEKEFSGDLGRSHRQRIVDILLEILQPDTATWNELGCLLTFISQQISLNNLPEDRSLIDHVFNYLKTKDVEDETFRQHLEREEAWMDLIRSNSLVHISMTDMIETAKEAKCYRVLEHLLERNKSYDKVFNCYLMDPSRQNEVFDFVEKNSDKPEYDLNRQLIENLPKLLVVNHNEMSRIIVDRYSDSINAIIKSLEDDKSIFFTFLEDLLTYGHNLQPDQMNQYLTLLSENDPSSVLQFLRNNDNYHVEKALEVVRHHGLNESVIYLLEKNGNYIEAFDLLLDILKQTDESEAESVGMQLCSLCARASKTLPENDREKIWFCFLQEILSKPIYSQITKSVLHAASAHVDLMKLVQTVFNSSSHHGSFGDVKQLVLGMLSNSKYEMLLLQTTAQILDNDLYQMLYKEKKIANRGVSVKSVKCLVCRQPLQKQSEIMIYGVCGHSIHVSCKLDSGNSNQNRCPRCDTKVANDAMTISQPPVNIFKHSVESTLSELHTTAPIRIGIGTNN